MSDLARDCSLAAKVLKDAGEFETGQAILNEAAARIEQLEAVLAAADELAKAVAAQKSFGIPAVSPRTHTALAAYREARK